MMANFHCVIITMIVVFIAEASAQCNHGELRLVDGCVPNEGRVEVCACGSRTCSWGTVCDDQWDDKDARVVCRQLGYNPDGAMAFSGALYGQGQGDIFLDNVWCRGSEATLLECNRYHRELFVHNCYHWEDAGVKCYSNKDEDIIKNISASLQLSTPCISAYTALIAWTSQNTIQHQPSSYKIECFSRQHHTTMMVNNTTFSVELFGLLPSTSYNCCVSAVCGSYTARAVCTEIATTMIPPSGGSTVKSSAADTIGGVLGFIIIILLILLAVLGVALVYLLQPRLFRRVLPKQNSTDVPVRRNVSYATNTASQSTASVSQGAQGAAGQNEMDTAAAADYSRIGPSYETIDSRRQQQRPAVTVTGRDQVSQARLSERYEFSEPHLAAMISAGGSGGTQGNEAAAAMDYEVPLQSEEHEEYSHLQH